MSLGPKHQVLSREPGAKLRRVSERDGGPYYFIELNGRTVGSASGCAAKAWESALQRLSEGAA